MGESACVYVREWERVSACVANCFSSGSKKVTLTFEK